MFYVDPDRDLAIAQIPRAGIHCFHDWLGRSFRVVSNDEAMKVRTRVAFYRYPLDRPKSAYSLFYWLRERGTSHDTRAPLDSWESFVDFMLENENGHWIPQSVLTGDVPTIIHRFENLYDHWEKYRPGKRPERLNSFTRLPTNDYRKQDLIAYYANDLERWEAAS